jgi:hypothetical protein
MSTPDVIPTYLSRDELRAILTVLRKHMPLDPPRESMFRYLEMKVGDSCAWTPELKARLEADRVREGFPPSPKETSTKLLDEPRLLPSPQDRRPRSQPSVGPGPE